MMMDQPDLRRRMASASRERIAEKYDLRKNVARLSALFTRYASQKDGPSDVSKESRVVDSLHSQGSLNHT